MPDEDRSLYELAEQVVLNVAAGLAGYKGPLVGALAQGAVTAGGGRAEPYRFDYRVASPGT
jgi:hypothetical protein